MGSISAPLLAATSTALIALVVSASDKMRWPNLTLLLLMGAAAAFIACVQLTFWARRFVVTPSELAEWWPGDHSEAREKELHYEQSWHLARFLTWANRARQAYNVGILCLLGSLPGMLTPPGHLSAIGFFRAVSVLIALAALIAEAVWIWAAWKHHRRLDPVTKDA
jgi:hypothetical protein